MSTPLFAPPPPPQAVTHATAPPPATTTPASPLPPASSGSPPPPSAERHFTLDEVQKFTGGFPEKNLLGEGWYGRVYRGVLPNGEDVAVKRLNFGRQGMRAFRNEVEIMSRVHHKHVVSLVGSCTTASERILVCELVPNKTLEFHLHGEGQPTLDWPTRVKIALGCAKGLAYLHEDCHPKIMHCDILGTNILVDNEFEPKIADFGLAECTSDANSHVSTNVKGAFGCLGPENVSSGNLAEKYDIFSFGVVLLELITGCKREGPTHDRNWLVNRARPLLPKALKDGNYSLFVDPKLQNIYDNNEMARVVACAAACVRRSADRRPRMSNIVRALEGDLPLSKVKDGITPWQCFLHCFCGSWDCGTSQEYGSSHYSEPTSDDGLHPSGSSSKGPSHQTTRDLEMGTMERDGQGFSGGCWDCGTSQEYGSSHYSEPTSDDGLHPSSSSTEGPSHQTTRDLEMGTMERDGRAFGGGS